ncbi:transcriptional regulator (plasmid) [Agrobacterium tumefaciens]|nr:transcriptional regulator [Agrobacterium tumefaciens]
MREVVVASPAYLQRQGMPEEPADLLRHECIRARMTGGRIYHWEFSRGGRSYTLNVPGRLTLDDSGLMLDAALNGVGLAYLSERAVAPFLSTGRLKKVLDDWTPATSALSLYYPGRRQVPQKLRAFIELARSYSRTAAESDTSPRSVG